MNSSLTLRCLTAVMCLLAGAAVAQDRAPAPSYDPTPFREYGWVEFGYAYLPAFDATLSAVTTNGVVDQDLELKMGPGFAVHGGLGESFSRWISGELLAGFYYHGVDEATGADGAGRAWDVSLLQVPVMFSFASARGPTKAIVPDFLIGSILSLFFNSTKL